jgi:hypothetical protein
MTVEDQIEAYIAGQPEPKRSDMRSLHGAVQKLMPGSELWFLDGKDSTGKAVTNPDIGYGRQTLRYAGGGARAFYQVGVSATKAGISVYIIGIDDKTYLPRTYGETIGKASVTGYCIKFRRLDDIDMQVLGAAIRDGVEATSRS